MRNWPVILTIASHLVLNGVPGWAQSKAEEEVSLARLVEEYERTEKTLAEVKGQLKRTLTTVQVRRLRAEIRRLEARLQELAETLQEMVEPPRPAVTTEAPVSLEQQLKSQEQRHETILESDVEQRLPSK